MTETPILIKNDKKVTTLQPSDSVLLQPRVVTMKDHSEITLRGANAREIQAIENNIWTAARDGDGFCLDEFCPTNGHFLHKFILDPKVVIATDYHGNLKGSALCGFSSLTRVPGSLFSAYFIIQKSERRKGIASELLKVVCELSRKNSCDILLFDVFANNQPTMEWLFKQGFVITGSIPHCGYVANRGFTPTLLMYKQLYETTEKPISSKL